MPYKALNRLGLTEIQPNGWLLDQLNIQMNGLTGKLYDLWDSVGSYSGWLGGTGESWERAPYYLDGLVPLSYFLNNQKSWDICMQFIEWTLNSQDENGNFGPEVTKNDQWSRFAMLKVLIQYYEIRKDNRVPVFIKNYFKYYDKLIEDTAIINWSKARVPELLYSLKWLYEVSGDTELLSFIDHINASSFDWNDYLNAFPFPRPTAYYIDWNSMSKLNPVIFDTVFPYHATHIVNLTMGFKHPALSFYFTGDEKYREIARRGLEDVIKNHGVVSGCINGDEHLAGNSPIQGSELCSVVEYMFSLQTLIEVFGDRYYGDMIERLAYNALPATITEDFMAHQYLQQANQVVSDVSKRAWFNNRDDANVYGLEPHFGCCTANMHQGWPKFVNSLWYKEGKNCLVNMVLAPSTVSTDVDGEKIEVSLTTEYPFKDTLNYKIISAPLKESTIKIRIPSWCLDVKINCETAIIDLDSGFIIIKKVFSKGEEFCVTLPMNIKISNWYKDSVAVERGALVYGLEIKENWKVIKEVNGLKDYAVYADSDWNYALSPDLSATVQQFDVSKVPFAKENPPIALFVKAKKVDEWVVEKNSAGDIPRVAANYAAEEEQVRLIPFGCTKLRISQFPTY